MWNSQHNNNPYQSAISYIVIAVQYICSVFPLCGHNFCPINEAYEFTRCHGKL